MVAARGRELLGRLAQLGLAVVMAAAMVLIWPRLAVPRVGYEGIWFAAAWLAILAGPVVLNLFVSPQDRRAKLAHTFEAGTLSHATFVMGALFLSLLAAAPHLGNYKLWLGVVYLGGLVLRLAGLSLVLRAEMLEGKTGGLGLAGAGAAIAALAGLLIIPWVRPEVAALWPPPWSQLWGPVLAAVIWGGISGAVLLVTRLWGASQRTAWLTYLAVGLGPGPALAVSLLPLIPLGLALAVLCGLALLRLLAPARAPAGPSEPLPMSLYWLLRALMILWWGVGAALTLAAAWWQPRLADLFAHGLWLRALALGGFVVSCAGLLAEYTLPLVGRPRWMDLGAERKLPGVIISALALIAALAPLALTDPYENPAHLSRELARGRAELLAEPVVLSPERPSVELEVPAWLTEVSRVFVVSYLEHGSKVEQGRPVVQLVAVDDLDFPHIFPLLAGIDSAAWDINKRDAAVQAAHRPARVADTWIVYTPTGEAFTAQSYLAGLYLGHQVARVKRVKLSYVYENPSGRPPLEAVIRRVYIN